MKILILFELILHFMHTSAGHYGEGLFFLIENFSCHVSSTSILELSSITVQFLAVSTTSRLHAMDSGIIASIKGWYRTVQYNWALYLLDNLELHIYK